MCDPPSHIKDAAHRGPFRKQLTDLPWFAGSGTARPIVQPSNAFREFGSDYTQDETVSPRAREKRKLGAVQFQRLQVLVGPRR